MIVCWSPKGGSGTTVVAASLALMSSRSRPTWLVDLAGDAPAVLGLPEPSSPGVGDWLSSSTADAEAWSRLAVAASDTLQVIPVGHTMPAFAAPELRWAALAQLLAAAPQHVVIDAGAGCPPPALLHRAHASLLVTRSCYLSLRRAVGMGVTPTGVVLLLEPARALGPTDVEHALGAPVVARVPYDPGIARAVDAGLLATRLPPSLARPLRGAA